MSQYFYFQDVLNMQAQSNGPTETEDYADKEGNFPTT